MKQLEMRFEANEWSTFVESIGNENEKEKKSEEKQFLQTVSLCLSSQMNKASTSFFSRHPKKKKEKKRKCLYVVHRIQAYVVHRIQAYVVHRIQAYVVHRIQASFLLSASSHAA